MGVVSAIVRAIGVSTRLAARTGRWRAVNGAFDNARRRLERLLARRKRAIAAAGLAAAWLGLGHSRKSHRRDPGANSHHDLVWGYRPVLLCCNCSIEGVSKGRL